MKTKKIADKPAVVSDGAAAAAAPKKARAPRATTHKHKKAMTAAPEAAPVKAVQVTETQGPTHEQIAVRAYLIGEARGFAGGSPIEDWFQAEQQLREELQGRA